MTTSFMTEFKIGFREKTYLHEKVHSSQEMQLERQKDLKIYQAQAMEINEQLRAFQNCASANNTLLLNFSPGDLCKTPTTSKTLPQW
jgi:hypothetical protein